MHDIVDGWCSIISTFTDSFSITLIQQNPKGKKTLFLSLLILSVIPKHRHFASWKHRVIVLIPKS